MLENIIELTLSNHIKEQNSFFVFPTQTAADLWADKIIFLNNINAVATERFIAWDQFKGDSIRSTHQNKTSIPSVMRKIFTEMIITKNFKKPFFKEIIVPEYSNQSLGFVNWISSLLPSLSLWKKNFDRNKNTPDNEDLDLLELYRRYNSFLEQNNLFDPAWETPPFKSDGKHYFIFFPEILSDYSEYKNILEDSKDSITIIYVPKMTEASKPSVDFFPDSRTEIKNIALYIRKCHEEDNINWTDIAISIPDMETYGLYIKRELDLYQIPNVVKYAKPLSDTGAGSFFEQAKDCVSEKFNFNSIKNLLFNTELPWKENDIINQVINFGKENNCICSFNYDNEIVDVWEKSFNEAKTEELARIFYKELKDHLTRFVSSKTFEELRNNYFEFREKFFNMELCPAQTDRIISRCITELNSLIDIEKNFPNCNISNHFDFFVNYLSEKNYLAQSENQGVQIIPYKLGACAPFSCHIIVDASQSSISVIYKELSFLREDKRIKLLKNTDSNVTDLFINLYRINSDKVYFTASSKTFSGYSQASSYLTENNLTKQENIVPLEKDFYCQEKSWFLKNTNTKIAPFQDKITEIEKTGFENWKNSQNQNKNDVDLSLKKIDEIIRQTRYSNDKIKISTTHLKYFFNCPRIWLQKYISKIEQQNNEAELMDYFAMGNLYHKILELYCVELKKRKMIVHVSENGLDENYSKILTESIDTAIKIEKNSYLEKELLKTTKTALSNEIKNTVESFSRFFEGCTVIDMEKNLYYQNPEKDYICEGKIDCLLSDDSESEFILIDFKSSNVPENLYYGITDTTEKKDSGKSDDETPDFQMPMYLYLLKNQEKPIIVENCGFFSIKTGLCTPVLGETLQKRVSAIKKSRNQKDAITLDTFEPTMQKFLDSMEEYSLKIKTKDFSINNDNQDFAKCNSCNYRAICRRTFNISRQD